MAPIPDLHLDYPDAKKKGSEDRHQLNESPEMKVPTANEGGCAQSGTSAASIYRIWSTDDGRQKSRRREEYCSLASYPEPVKVIINFRTSSFHYDVLR